MQIVTNILMRRKWRSTYASHLTQLKVSGRAVDFSFFIWSVIRRALGYLKVADLEGAVLHQRDSLVVSQDSLAVLLPLDAWRGVPHDVAVQLDGGARR